MNPPQMQVVPLTKIVKALILANVVIWIGAVLILQGLVLQNDVVFNLFALTPAAVVEKFWVWQLFTYMFLHAHGVTHILFNMLVLWWFGSELETRWGQKFFLTYYLVCGVGAGAIYLIGCLTYYLITGHVFGMAAQLVGASGATYGLLLAYGLLFGERVIAFMMVFPMKAKYFTLIIGAVELFTLMDSGMGSSVANLAHLGGIVVGFLYLTFVARWRARKSSGGMKRGRKLKLVVNNEPFEKKTSEQGPRYWN